MSKFDFNQSADKANLEQIYEYKGLVLDSYNGSVMYGVFIGDDKQVFTFSESSLRIVLTEGFSDWDKGAVTRANHKGAKAFCDAYRAMAHLWNTQPKGQPRMRVLQKMLSAMPAREAIYGRERVSLEDQKLLLDNAVLHQAPDDFLAVSSAITVNQGGAPAIDSRGVIAYLGVDYENVRLYLQGVDEAGDRDWTEMLVQASGKFGNLNGLFSTNPDAHPSKKSMTAGFM